MGPMIVVLVRDRDLTDLPARGLYVILAGLVPLRGCTEVLLERALQLVEPLLLLTLGLTKELDLREPPIGSRLEMEMHGTFREAKELAAHFIVTVRDLLRPVLSNHLQEGLFGKAPRHIESRGIKRKCSCYVHLTARPNGSRLSCGALKKDSFPNLRAPSASSAC
jgi:hypothetical protein